MSSCLKFLPVLLLLTVLTACGSGSSKVDADVILATPDHDSTPFRVNGKLLLGGSLQEEGATFTPTGTVSNFAGTVGTPGNTNATGTAASFNRPLGITTDGTSLYVADYDNHIIRMISSSGVVTYFAGTTGVQGSYDSDASGIGPFFNHPSAITTDGEYLYVTDSYNYTIRKINIESKEVKTLAGLAGTSGAVDAALGKNARFNLLNGITTDGKYLYVTDSYNTIRRVDKVTGATSTLAGKAGVIGSTDGVGEAASFNLPARITTDGTYLYVTDTNNRTIRRISLITHKVETIVGNADAAPGRTDATGSGTNALFYQLNGITMDGTHLYVTDSYNNTIYKIQKNEPWSVSKVAGITGTAGHDDTALVNGVQVIPTFDTPIGITTDGTALFVTDTRNHTIRKIQ